MTLSSPNFNARNLPVSMLVLHYTGMESADAALERLCCAKAEVSAHWVVHEDGRLVSLVDEASRAWHAGQSCWNGITDVNSASIGVEIVNGGHDFPNPDGTLPDYPNVQIQSVIKLCKDITARHNIAPRNVVGHSDIAPERKADPGEHFPWAHLAAAGVGLWPDIDFDEDQDQRLLFEAGDRDRAVAVLQRGLAEIGYNQSVTGNFDPQTQAVIRAVQRRYRPEKIDGFIDVQMVEIIKGLSEILKVG